MFTYLPRETPCWRSELWAVGSAARVQCWASRTSSARSQGIWVDYIPTCSSPSTPRPPNTAMELTEALLSHFPAGESGLTGTGLQPETSLGLPLGSTGALQVGGAWAAWRERPSGTDTSGPV